MNKEEFIKKLDSLLKDIPDEEKEEILYDYNEHFSIGLADGKTEEEIARSLGDPKKIAKEIKVNAIVQKAEKNNSSVNILRAVFAAAGLGFFNLVFILGPFMGIAGTLFALIVSGGAITFAGIAVFFATFIDPFIPQLIDISVNPLVTIFTGIGLSAMGGLWIIGATSLTKLFYRLTVKYLKWNIRVIENRRS